MKRYGDEDFLFLIQREEALKQQAEEGHVNNIRDGYIILRDETIPFLEVPIAEYGFSMIVPEALAEMSEEHLVLKYPHASRPHYVLTSPGTTMNLAFQYTEDKLPPEETEYARDTIRNVVMKAHHASEAEGCKTIQAGETKIACFDFISKAPDSDLYNLMFLFSLQGRMMLGTFNCLEPNRHEWSEIALQMIASVNTQMLRLVNTP